MRWRWSIVTHTRYVQMRNLPLVQWRAVFGGAVLGLAIMLLLTSFWLALGAGSDVQGIMGNMEWYVAGSAIFAMLLGGYLAGWLSGVRGISAGLVNGLTVWALVLITGLLVGTPAVIGVLGLGEVTAVDGIAPGASQAAWATFWSLLIGAGAATIGGLLGGMTPRAVGASAAVHGDDLEDRHDHEPGYARDRYDDRRYEERREERDLDRDRELDERERRIAQRERELDEREREYRRRAS